MFVLCCRCSDDHKCSCNPGFTADDCSISKFILLCAIFILCCLCVIVWYANLCVLFVFVCFLFFLYLFYVYVIVVVCVILCLFYLYVCLLYVYCLFIVILFVLSAIIHDLAMPSTVCVCVDIDDCLLIECHNGGECIDKVDAAECNCPVTSNHLESFC